MEQELHVEIRQAVESDDLETLEELATHKSMFVRARVAGNKNISEELHNILLDDHDVGVVYWALGNPRLTKAQYIKVFKRFLQPEYSQLVHSALAGHRFATIRQLRELFKFNKWSINLAVLNNHNRNPKKFLELIEPLLPPTTKHSKDWDAVEQRAYFRTYGVWWKPIEDEDKGAVS